MSDLTRWEPSREIVSLRDAMDRLFAESFFLPRNWMANRKVEIETIPLDLYEEGNNLFAKASMPGVKPEDLKVQVEDEVLIISGETKQEEECKEKNYHVREHRYGRFERSVTLPSPVQVDKAEAVFENGLLTVTLPEAAEQARGKQIAVQVKK